MEKDAGRAGVFLCAIEQGAPRVAQGVASDGALSYKRNKPSDDKCRILLLQHSRQVPIARTRISKKQ